MAGYSKKSLAAKLGIKEAYRIFLVRPPANYRQLLEPLPDRVVIGRKMNGSFNLIQAFVTDKRTLNKEFPLLKKHTSRTGSLWVSWPKGSSEFNENTVREIGLKNGLVDVKVIAVDETWSGLKFVYRAEQRLF